MRAQVTLQPGQKGTKALIERYGKQLIFVRYRYDADLCRRLKTVELVIEEKPWLPSPMKPEKSSLVGVQVGLREVELQRQIKRAGGKWNAQRKLWEMRRSEALRLGLKDRITASEVSINRN